MPTHGVRILVRFVSRVGGCLFVCPFVCLLALVWMSVCSFLCLLLRGCLFVSCACVRFVVCAFVCLLVRVFVCLFARLCLFIACLLACLFACLFVSDVYWCIHWPDMLMPQLGKPKPYYEPAPV